MQVAVGQDPLIGQILEGLYRVDELMAQGGMGSIYRATQMRLNFPVAVKALRPDLVADEKIVKRFIREALAVSQLRHPHVVRLYDAGRTPQGVHFIVMEYLPGTSLDQRIEKDRRMDPYAAMSVVSQSAAALGMAHRKGIIHRDLKPANIYLVDAEGVDIFAKVLDFGIAKFHPNTGEDMTKLTVAGSTMGTPHYMSPEQIQGHEIKRWADIYSLGIILWESVVGAPPFKGDSPMEVFMGHIEDPLPPIKKVAPDLKLPDGLEAIIKRALQKRPIDRFQNMEEFKTAIDQINNSDAPAPGKAPRASGAQMLSPGANNTKLYIIIALMAVVIIILGVLLALIGNDNKNTPTPQATATPDAHETAKKPTQPPPTVAPPEVTPDPPPPAPKAYLRLFSHPSGAAVFIGDEEKGKTPYKHDPISDITGPLEFTLRLDKHTEQKVTLEPKSGLVTGQFVHLNGEGAKDKPQGDTEIFVNGDQGAQVLLGEEVIIKDTPNSATLKHTKGTDRVTLTLRKPGYLDETLVVPMVKDQTLKIDHFLMISEDK